MTIGQTLTNQILWSPKDFLATLKLISCLFASKFEFSDYDHLTGGLGNSLSFMNLPQRHSFVPDRLPYKLPEEGFPQLIHCESTLFYWLHAFFGVSSESPRSLFAVSSESLHSFLRLFSQIDDWKAPEALEPKAIQKPFHTVSNTLHNSIEKLENE